MQLTKRRSTAATLALFAFTGEAAANEREFTLSRDWFLPDAGEMEFESRWFFDTTRGDYHGTLEFEYGVTDWFTVEPGIVFADSGTDDLDGEAAELELRFHYGEFELDSILPALALEFEFPFDGDEDVTGEAKFVLSRYGSSGDDFTFNFNVVTPLEGETDSTTEATFGWLHHLDGTAADEGHDELGGWSRGLGVGIELFHDFEADHTKVGPLVRYAFADDAVLLASYVIGVEGGHEDSDLLSLVLEFEL